MTSATSSHNVKLHRLAKWGAGPVVLVVVAIAIFLVMRSPPAPPSPEEWWRQLSTQWSGEPLNVVLVTIDTLRADRLSCYGSELVQTPNIDRFAREGVRFSNAASTVPFTLPSHSSIMTGTYPPYHGVRENVGYFLDDSLPTTAQLLKANGYSTAGFVSAFVLDSKWGISRGFDTYFDDFDVASLNQVNLGSVQRNGKETLDEAVRWLDRRPAAPFFLWLHLFDPHDPYEPPEPFKSQYAERPYEAEVAYTDSLVGEFRAALDQRGLTDRSLVVVTADHGEGLGQHRESFHGYFIYESTVHVPLIIRLPSALLGGRVVDDAVSHVDLQATILAAVGQPPPKGTQGSSLLPLMLETGEDADRAVYSESYYSLYHYGWAPLRSIRTRRYKFIDAPQPELYDLTTDQKERQNVLLDQRRTSRELKDRLDTLRESLERPESEVARRTDLDEETLAQLQALGYIAGSGEFVTTEESDLPRADPKDKIEIHQSIMWAQSNIGKGDFAKAEKRLKEVIEVDPEMIDAHQMLGSIASQQQRYEEAVTHFQQALALDNNHQTSLWGLANSYRLLGRSDEALVGFERLRRLNPHDSKAAVAVTDIYVEQGRLEEALVSIAEATGSEDAPARTHNQHGELLVLAGRPQEAVEQFRRALEKNDQLAQPRYNLAVIHEEAGQSDLAIREYEETIARAPRHYQAQFNLGRLYGRQGNLDRQQALYEAAIDSNPDFVRGYYFLAKLLMDRGGDLGRAESLTREGLLKDTDHHAGPFGYYLLADILNRQDRPSEARRALDEGRRIQAERG